MKNKITILFLLLTISGFSQKWNPIKGESYVDIIVDNNNDTTFLDPVQFYYPINDYTDINSDGVEAYMLNCYSRTMKLLKEPILYKKKDRKFIRIVLLENLTSTSYRIERIDNSSYKLITSKLDGNYQNPSNEIIDSVTINNAEYEEISSLLLKSNIWAIKPHSVKFYAVDEKNMLLFESNIYGGYTFTDIYIPFTQDNPFFKELYKSIQKIKKSS